MLNEPLRFLKREVSYSHLHLAKIALGYVVENALGKGQRWMWRDWLVVKRLCCSSSGER